MSEAVVPLYGIINRETEELTGLTYPGGGADRYPVVSGGGPVTSGAWVTPPSLFRLRLTGTGTATVDARDKLGAITLGIATYTTSAATNQIEYPYLGYAASDLRVTLTGTATAEVM